LANRPTIGTLAQTIGTLETRNQQQTQTISHNPKSIVDHGLPPMMGHCVGSPTDSPSIPKDKDHVPATLNPTVLPDPEIRGVTKDTMSREHSYEIWEKYSKGDGPFEYTTEGSLKLFIQPVLTDIEVAIRGFLGREYSLRFETELKTFNEKADYWVPLRSGKPVGVVQIKKSYNEWRFLCLEDTAADAGKMVMPDIAQLPAQGDYITTLLPEYPSWVFKVAGDQPNTPGRLPFLQRVLTSTTRALRNRVVSVVPTASRTPTIHRRVCATRVFNRDDPALITAIAAIFIEMAMSPATKLTALGDPHHPHRIMSPEKWEWGTIPANFQVKFEDFPRANASHFYLLLRLGMGKNGHVYLSSTSSGTACAIKFPLLPLFRPNIDDNRKMEHLANIRQRSASLSYRWRKIWDASGVHVITLYGQPALIMPYFKMCKGDASVQDEDVKKAAGDAIEQMTQ